MAALFILLAGCAGDLPRDVPDDGPVTIFDGSPGPLPDAGDAAPGVEVGVVPDQGGGQEQGVVPDQKLAPDNGTSSVLPGSGVMQAQDGYIMPNGQLQQSFWRGNQGWYRSVPMKSDGTPDWSKAGAWGGPVLLSALPGSGSMQAQNGYIMPSGQLQQSIWRGNQGWYRSVPMKSNGTPDWNKASAWDGPLLP